jgi:metallo-beta-lactamase class B
MNKLISFVAAAALCACVSQSGPLPSLSSAEAIAAAETAPLGDQARDAHWNDPFPPFNVIGDIYYVGTAGVSSYLITTSGGHFLIDGALAQSAPQIRANIATLGFDIRDVKYLLNTHAHYDHAGGLASLQRASGATFVASAADRAPLEAGRIAYGPSAPITFPPIRVDRVIADGESLTLGGVTLTAVMTPGHTEGCTSWMMQATGADGAPHHVFLHCSATVGGNSLDPEAYPGIVANYRRSFARVREIHVDVFLANHGVFFDLVGKRARQIAGDANAFVDPQGLANFNAEQEKAFEDELAKEEAAAAATH